MSYDLYFTKPRITEHEFAAYFRDRPNYELSESQAFYQNEDTGVYFIIDHEKPEEDDPEAIDSTAILNLNYYRPHFFGLEAVEEVAAFVDHFGFSIHDAQYEGMEDGPFSRDGFLRGWNHGNEFAYSAILGSKNAPEAVWTLPGERLEGAWKWNYEKANIQESFGEGRFVPRIFFMAIDGRVASVIVWPDAISELIPRVDFLLIQRNELAPKSLFGAKKKDQILLPFAEVLSDLDPYATSDYSLPAYNLPAPRVPERLRKCIRDLKPTGITGEGLPRDEVLNDEIVVKFKKN